MNIHLHEWFVIFYGFHVGKYTFNPWILWAIAIRYRACQTIKTHYTLVMLTWQAGNKHRRFEDVSGYLKLEFIRCDAVWYIYLHGNRQNSWRNPTNMGKSSTFPLGKFATQPGVTSRCLGFACLKNRIFWVIGFVPKGHTCWILTHTIMYGIFTCMDGWFYSKCR